MAWFAVPAAVALGATWVSAPASAAISPPQIVNVDGGGSDTARTIAVDAAGNAYLGGSISTGPDSQGQFSVVKLNAQGNVVWRANFSGNDAMLGGATSLGVDPAGNVYSAGFILNDPSVGVTSDTVLAKFGPTGQELWSRRIRGGPAYARVAATADGFVAGGRAATGEIVTQRFDPNGVLRWSRFCRHPRRRHTRLSFSASVTWRSRRTATWWCPTRSTTTVTGSPLTTTPPCTTRRATPCGAKCSPWTV